MRVGRFENQTSDHSCQGKDGINQHYIQKGWMLEGRFVEVWSIGELKIFVASMPNQSERYKEKDEGTAYSTCIGYEELRVLFKKYNYNNWYWYYNGPQTLNNFAIVL